MVFRNKFIIMDNCICCIPYKPRYKRLVDNIFPSSLEEGLVRSEMEKLTYYAVSAPEKLDRIGVYLAKRLTRDIQRRRDSYVFIAMEALNQLLLACHAQQINLFVESFLKMVATLLESANPEFQALGTNSFEKFSKIEEDTPSYHRRYDFFVSKFTSMCYSNETNLEARQKIKLHGVRGIRGVIRKTVTDELQVNIWEKQHMDKLIPALLYTMQDHSDTILYEDGGQIPDISSSHPWMLAEESLRELLSRAGFANVPAAISPALAHMDSQKLWTPDNTFAIRSFKIFMYAIQSQNTHVIIKMLLDHLDVHSQENEAIKASLLRVLCAVVSIPSCAIGPSVIDVFNRLSKHLKALTEVPNQQTFEETLIDTTRVLANVVPDYQRLEIMSFYINKAHEALSGGAGFEENLRYSTLLIQCLKSISSTCQVNVNLSSLSSSLLDPLLKVALLAEPSHRLLVQQVLISLLDKNSNFNKLEVVNDQTDLNGKELLSATPGKQDVDFLDRKLPNIYHWLFESFTLDNNTCENLIMLYKCVGVLCLSLTCSDVIMELCRLTLAVQSVAIDWLNSLAPTSDPIPVCQLMSVTACNMIVLSHLSTISQFQSYVSEVLHKREKIVPEFLPNILLTSKSYSLKLNSEKLSEVTFSSGEIHNALTGHSGFNVEKLNEPFLAHLPLDNVSVDVQRGAIDVESINIQFTIAEDSVVEVDGLMPASAITFEYLKDIASKPPRKRAEQLEINKKEGERILAAEFEQLIAEMKPNPTIKALDFIHQIFGDANMDEEEGNEETELIMPSIF